MYLRRDCAAGVRFLAAVKAGCGVKPSARAAGVGKQTAYRWLRESFTELREHGVSVGCPGRAGLLLAAGCWSGSSTAWSGRSARDTTGRSTSIVRTRSGGASWLAAASRKLARPRVSAATAPGAETRPVRGGRAFTVEVRLTGIVGALFLMRPARTGLDRCPQTMVGTTSAEPRVSVPCRSSPMDHPPGAPRRWSRGCPHRGGHTSYGLACPWRRLRSWPRVW